MTRKSDLDNDRLSALDRLFNPRSIAIVGASERSIWSVSAYDNLIRFKFPGVIHAINPKGGTIHGLAAATSCAAVGAQIDAALVMVPQTALLDTIHDLAAAGIGGAVILSSGFAETGEAGAAAQRLVADAARAAGIRLIGPNCLGFANFTKHTPIWTNPIRRGLANPTIALVSQSGALGGQMEQFCYQQRIGLTHLVSTGNEADITVADVIEYLAIRSEAKAIAIFLETVRNPDHFLRAVTAANLAGKPIVVLKVGSSQAAAKAAQAHTGSLVGNDQVFDALCRRMGITRVHSLEALIVTADLFARIGPVGGDGVGLIAMSGGLCEIAIDQAEAEAIPIPPPAAETLASLREKLPSYATPNNPLDITGAAMTEPELIETAIVEMSRDPDIGLVGYVFDIPQRSDARGFANRFIGAVGSGFAKGAKPGLMFSHTMTSVSGDGRALADAAGLAYSGGGLNLTLTAIGHLFRWSKSRRKRGEPPFAASERDSRLASERAVLDHLAAHGVDVIPGSTASTADEAVALSHTFGMPVVLKIASPDIQHKTEVGGVLLNMTDEAAVRAGFDAIIKRVSMARPDARIDGVIVSPMRKGGVELFVGTMRDPQWGPAITVGLGGVLVEALKDNSIRLLPVSEADALEMLDELRGKALLDGFRGTHPVDRAAAARAIVAVGDAALALGPQLLSLEVNPLLADGSRLEALDGLTIWEDQNAQA